jgi:hypothetical protein
MNQSHIVRRVLCAAALIGAAGVASAQVKISQVYGGGGNGGTAGNATYLSDFIEIHNTGAPQDLTGWSVQYTSSAGTTWTVTSLPSLILGTGQYLLVKQADGSTVPAGQSLALPTPQATGAIAMSATDFKVALVSSTTALVGGVPTYSGAPTLVDFVGAGTANWNDASASGVTHTTANNAPAASNTNSIYRRTCGALDTPNSYLDWGVGLVNPRNTSTTPNTGLNVSGMVHPYFAEEGQTVKIQVSPFVCAGGPLTGPTAVTADLSSIGGSATQTLFDDGTNGDQVIGDGIYSFDATVAPATTTGTKTFQISATDALLGGGTTVGLEVKALATPDNDNCSTASALAIPSTTLGNFTGATVEYNPITTFAAPLISFSAMQTKRGLWYSFVGTGNTVTVSMCATLPSFDSVFVVAVGRCDGFTVVDTGDDNGPVCTGNQASKSFCTELGTTYFLWVSPFAIGATTNAFQLDISDNGTPCTGAVASTVCAAPTGGAAEDEGRQGPSANDGCDGNPASATGLFQTLTPGTFPAFNAVLGTSRSFNDRRDFDWYRFQAATSDIFSAQITSQFPGTVEFRQLSGTGTCSTNTLLVQSAVGPRCGTTVLNSTVTAGNWYALRVMPLASPVLTAPLTTASLGGMALSPTLNHYKLEARLGGPPANDLCANAATLVASQAGNTGSATNDGTSSCDATGNDVWYTFTNGAAAVNLNLDTCASGTDTVISVYDSCGGLELACNDDATGTPCSGPASALSLLVSPSQTVKIRVSDKGVGTSFTLNRTITIPNDPCSGAILVAIPSATAGTTVGATLDAGLPVCTGPGVNDFGGNTAITAPSLWYRVNSPVNQTIYADVLNASHDSKLSVYTGSCAAPVCVTMNDDVNGAFKSKLAFQAVAGQDYFIMVHGFATAAGTFTLNVTADATPSNDLCANATGLTGISGSIGGTNAGATGDNTTVDSQTIATCATDATHYDTWYTFTPSCSGSVTFTTCGAFDTILSVHSACSTASAGNLITGACNDNGAGACAPGSEVTVALTGGVPVFVRVATAGALTPSAGGGAAYTLTWAEVDSDLDGVADCNDGCPLDPLKIAAGQCGCGVVDTDTDGDLTADCNDGCPTDPAKTAPGVCGCGVSDVDSDGDLTPDCNDGCPADPAKVAPGICGCGVSDADSDGDTVADCNDGCPNDPLKVVPGICGCGVADTDSDGDAVADCNDGCPNDPLKIAPGICGCGVADTDTDGDGTPDCNDGCPADPLKIAPGICGCGVADTDTDGDGVADCDDNCVTLANPLQEDCDLDNVGNACELANGTQTDFNFNSIPDNCEPGLTVSYCTSGTSSIGCVATIGGSGVASASATAGYFVTTSGVEGQRQAITYYSLFGPKAPPTPFGAGFLCVKAPTQRLGNLQAGGTPGFCNGSVQVDVLDWAQSHPNGQGVPFTAGLTLNFQSSIRDPLSPGTRVMSNAIQVTLLP